MTIQVKALKVKVKSLAAEALIIRLEEFKANGSPIVQENPQEVTRKSGASVIKWSTKRRHKENRPLYVSLRNHRIGDVRKEQRSALLAYGYIRGRGYKAMERKCQSYHRPDWDRVRSLVEKFTGVKFEKVGGPNLEAFAAWKAGAESPFRRKEFSEVK